MKKHFTIFVFLILSSSYSQSTKEIAEVKGKLQAIKEKLESRQKEIRDSLVLINIKIDLIDSELANSKIRDKALKTNLKRESKILEKPYSTSRVLFELSSNNEILIIDYYEYGSYYSVIHENKLGYIYEKDIKVTKEIKKLKKVSKSKSKLKYSSSLKPKKRIKRKNYRTYYRGSRGGCYYINSNGNKSYVARSLCN